MIERAETADGLRISFRPASGVEEELRELVAVENECCSWADWNVKTNAEQIVLDVRSTREGIATCTASLPTSSRPAARPTRVSRAFFGCGAAVPARAPRSGLDSDPRS